MNFTDKTIAAVFSANEFQNSIKKIYPRKSDFGLSFGGSVIM